MAEDRPDAASAQTASAQSGTPTPGTPTSAEGATARRTPLIIALSVLGALVFAYLLAGWLTGLRVGHDVTIGGVEVSGQSASQARETLGRALEQQRNERITFTVSADGARSAKKQSAQPGDLGVSVDVRRSVAQAAGFTLNPATIVGRMFGPDALPSVPEVDEGRFSNGAKTIAGGLTTKADAAGVTVAKNSAKVTPATTGLRVTADDVREALRAWPGSATLAVAGKDEAPQVTDEEAERVRDEVAKPALGREMKLNATADGGKTTPLQLSAASVASALTFTPDGDSLAPEIDGRKLRTALEEQNPKALTTGKDAGFTIKKRKPVVVPAKTGISVDANQLAERIQAAVAGGTGTADVTLSVRQPELTTVAAKRLEMKRISKFSTPYSSEYARDTNLRVASKRVSGTVVKPGETFSLNRTIKERTAANGYKRAHVISGGEMKEDYGGGVSQVSTTLFNAAFFAGARLDEHQAHSRWISRYPEGRESTLDWRTIDMRFTNTSKNPVVLDMYLKGGKVHAQIFGEKTLKVTSKSSGRFNYTSPQTITRPAGAGCSPQSPNSGWSIKIKRTMTDIKTGKVTRDGFTTVYKPVNAIRCEAPKKKD